MDPTLPVPGSAKERALLDSQGAHNMDNNLVTINKYTYANVNAYGTAFAAWFNATNTL